MAVNGDKFFVTIPQSHVAIAKEIRIIYWFSSPYSLIRLLSLDARKKCEEGHNVIDLRIIFFLFLPPHLLEMCEDYFSFSSFIFSSSSHFLHTSFTHCYKLSWTHFTAVVRFPFFFLLLFFFVLQELVFRSIFMCC